MFQIVCGWSPAERLVLPHVHAVLREIQGWGKYRDGAIISFMPYCLLHAKSREGVSFDGVVMVIPFCMVTEIGTIDGIIF